MKPVIGLITIGQSPRDDITTDLSEIWQERIEIMEIGALDDLTEEEIIELKPDKKETLLVSRLRNGLSVELAEERLNPLLVEKIRILENQVQLIFLMCTGEFTGLNAKVPLIQPDPILRNTVKGLLQADQTLGIMVPEKEQVSNMERIWSKYVDNNIVVEFGSPYGELSLIKERALKLKEKGAQLIVLDCMGYNKVMKGVVSSITEKPVILPRTLVARIIQELVNF